MNMRALSILVALAGLTSAQKLPTPTNPSDAGTPPPSIFEQAVNAAPNGAVIRVDDWEPVVKRNVRVRGDRDLTFVGGVFQSTDVMPALLFDTSDGPGTFESRTRTVSFYGTAVIPGTPKWRGTFNGVAAPGLMTGGIGRVILDTCSIRSNGGCIGGTLALTVRNSILQAGAWPVDVDCVPNDNSFQRGFPAVWAAPFCVVQIQNSYVKGGDAPRALGPCSWSCVGRGGSGVISEHGAVIVRSSTVLGGRGVLWGGCTGPTGYQFETGTVR